jgi:8-oxo-dGTP diphosphatase
MVRALVRAADADGVGLYRVGALIVRRGRVLLLRRAPHDSFPGLFELPSGGVEADEGILEALTREVREETGLRIATVVAYAGSFDYQSRRSGRAARQFNFVVEVNGGEPRLNPDEHDRLAWAGPDRLATFQVTDAVRAILERFWAQPG